MNSEPANNLESELAELRERIARLEAEQTASSAAFHALRTQMQDLETLLDAIPALIFRKDTEGRILWANATFCQAVNIPRAELAQRSMYRSAARPDIFNAVQQIDREVMVSGLPRLGIMERLPERPDHWFRVDKLPYYDPDGTAQGVIGFAVNITDLLQAQTAEHEQRLLAEALADSAAALNSTLDLSEVLERILINLDRVVPHDAADIMLVEDDIAHIVRCRGYAGRSPEDRVLSLTFDVRQMPRMQRARDTRQPQIITNTREGTDWKFIPETAWIASHIVTPIHRHDDFFGFLNVNSAQIDAFTPEHVRRLEMFANQAGIAIRNARLFEQTRREIKERQRTEAALETRQAHLRGLFENALDAIMLIDDDAHYIDANPAACALLGYSLNELRQMSVFEIAAPAYRVGFDQTWQRFRELRTQQGEYVVQHKDGSPIDVDLRAVANIVPGVHMSILRDSRERQAAEEQRVALVIEQERVKLLATFLENLSHEFGTPLSVIHTGLNTLEHTVLLDRTATKRVERIKEQTYYIGQLVEAMLTMARLDTGPEFVMHPCQINLIADNLYTAVSLQAEEKRLRLIRDFAPTLPLVNADPHELYQALYNLCLNAVQYTSEGGTIVLSTYPSGADVIFAVMDNGPGIPLQQIPHIFERFYRVDTARTVRRAGLGLSIARQIIALHGGAIEVDSLLQRGSTFRVVLPARSG